MQELNRYRKEADAPRWPQAATRAPERRPAGASARTAPALPATRSSRAPGAAQRVAALPRPVVFTNGVFDILHRGHVTYLAQARALGASLVVALNTDASARRLGKGPDRPLNSEQDRAGVLAALDSVEPGDLVRRGHAGASCWRTAARHLRQRRRLRHGDAGRDAALVRSWGGRALAMPFVDGYSTTALVKKIRG